MTPHAAKEAALDALADWWEEMGAPGEAGALEALKRAAAETPASAPAAPPATKRRGPAALEERIGEAWRMAAAAAGLDELKAAIESFEGCPLKAGANKTVVFDGVQGADLMVIGEGAGGQEDRVGLPFVGKAGQLLDKMLAAIGRSRAENAFISNVVYWRPPGNRNPEPDELAVCRPFVDRMVELCAPKVILAAGGVSAKSLLHAETGIMRLRGTENRFQTPSGFETLLIPTFHPAYLLRRPQDKSRAWRDLLLIQERLQEMGGPA